MNIAEIQIDQFGAWRNMALPINRHGVTVFHGPNEAGKSTLMRFVRGILYGFRERPGDRSHRAGSLRIGLPTGECRLHRKVGLGITAVRGDVSLSEQFGDIQHAGHAGPVLEGALQGISEAVYEHVFAVGLRELQELALLDDKEVAEHIYGLTLGPDGRRLMEACHGIREERRRMLDPVTNTGTLADHWAEHDRLQTAVRNLPDPAVRHAELCVQRDNLEAELASCRQRKTGVESQLRGQQFLASVHEPWNTVRNHSRQLHSLPVVTNFPEHGIERLQALDTELADLRQRREQLTAELKDQKGRARKLAGDPVLRKHAPAMHGFLLQRGWVSDLQSRMKDASQRLEACQKEFDAHRAQLGTTLTSTDQVDLSAAAQYRMAGIARSLKVVTLRRAGVRRSYVSLQRIARQQAEAIERKLKLLNVSSADEALSQAKRQMEDLKSLAALRLHEKELEERQAGIEALLTRMRPRQKLPGWVYSVLIAFCIAGAVLGCWGLFTGMRSSEIAGLTYILLGLTTAGVAWGIKSQFEGDMRQRLTEVEADSAQNLRELEATREQIHQLTASCDLSEFGDLEDEPIASPVRPLTKPRLPSAACSIFNDESNGDESPSLVQTLDHVRVKARTVSLKIWQKLRERIGRPAAPAIEPARSASDRPDLSQFSCARGNIDPSFELSLLQQISSRVTDLEQLRRQDQIARKTKVRLKDRRRKLKNCRREVETASQAWADLLRQIGFPENLKPEAAFEHWRLLAETNDHRRRCDETADELAQLQSLWTSFRHRLEEIDRRLNQHREGEQPVEILARWEVQLADLSQYHRERLENRKAEIARRRELSRAAKRAKELDTKRRALLLQGGAGEREEFEFRAHCFAQRATLETELAEAQAALQTLCEQHADLAIVESDLEQLDVAENGEGIETLEQELADLSGDIGRIGERLEGITRDLRTLENGREHSGLRFELAQSAERLERATEQWLALEAAAKSIDTMRQNFERTCQPRVLGMASRHLHRMTGGRFTNIWTPLDRRELRIEDARQTSYTVEQLSSGSREQLFLAVRLALIEELAQKGVRLPIILDDVFVNFDESRAEAAADVLLDFAAQGQQVLFFTCHKHLADIFVHRGAPRIELPAREDIEVQRLAG